MAFTSFFHVPQAGEKEIEKNAGDKTCDGVYEIMCADVDRGGKHQNEERHKQQEEPAATCMPSQ